jgi:uncharacterized LabA/DUF88 family protein
MAKLAVLIDADNAQAALAADLLEEVARYGTATVKRAYGDWTTTNLKSWKEQLHPHAIQPMQQFRNTRGKNATDSALIIDAMDLLHAGRLDGFCIVSSDSDFTRLAMRIREAGLVVYGFGERKTPEPFVKSCNKFVYTDILRDAEPEVVRQQEAAPEITSLLMPAVQASLREDGWALLSAIGHWVTKKDPSFDPRNYGYPKLGELVRAQPYLEVKDVPVSDGSSVHHVHVRPQPAASKKASA